MKIIEIKSRGYNYAKDKYMLCAIVSSERISREYKVFLFATAEEMYKVKVGDYLE